MIDYFGSEGRIMYRYDYAKKRLYGAGLKNAQITTTFAIPMAGCKHELAVSDEKNVMVVHWNGKSPNSTLVRNTTSVEEDQTEINNLDQGKVDPLGQLMTGTYRDDGCVRSVEPNGTLYLFRKNGEIAELVQGLYTIGGMAWNNKKKLFYVFDSCNYTIYEYIWSPHTGYISKKRMTMNVKYSTKYNKFLTKKVHLSFHQI